MTEQMRMATVLALVAAAISGLNHVLAGMAVRQAGEPLTVTGLRLAVAGIILAVVAAARSERLPRVRQEWCWAVGLGLLASAPFAFYFTAFLTVSPGAANLTRTSVMFLVALLAVPLFKERLAPGQWLGAAALLVGSGLIMGPASAVASEGLLLVVAAAALWGVEALAAKRALRQVTSLIAAMVRLAVAAGVVFVIAFVSAGPIKSGLGWDFWALAIGSGALLAGYVWCWYEALAKAPVTYVATLMLAAPAATSLVKAFLSRPVPIQTASRALVMLLAVVLVIRFLPRPASPR